MDQTYKTITFTCIYAIQSISVYLTLCITNMLIKNSITIKLIAATQP